MILLFLMIAIAFISSRILINKFVDNELEDIIESDEENLENILEEEEGEDGAIFTIESGHFANIKLKETDAGIKKKMSQNIKVLKTFWNAK